MFSKKIKYLFFLFIMAIGGCLIFTHADSDVLAPPIINAFEFQSVRQPNQFAIKIAQIAGLKRGMRVLSLGAGSFKDELYFASLGCDVVGIQEKETKDSVFQEGRGVTSVWGDIIDILPDIAGTFDVIYARGIFHYFSRQDLEKIFELLKPRMSQNSRICFVVKSQDDGYFIERESKEDPHTWLTPYLNPLNVEKKRQFFSINRIIQYLEKAGLFMAGYEPTEEVLPITMAPDLEDPRPSKLMEVIAVPKNADISGIENIGDIERELIDNLPSSARVFRKKAFDLYDQYRFSIPEEKIFSRQRHIESVTEIALMIGKEWGLSEEWLRIVWKGALLHDVGQARKRDYGLCIKIRKFAIAHSIPYSAQMIIEKMRLRGVFINEQSLSRLYVEFLSMIETAGFDIDQYGGRTSVERACKALFHDSYSRQIVIFHQEDFPSDIGIEDEVYLLIGHHTYPELLPDNVDPMVRICTEILKAADSIDSRNDAARRKVYGRKYPEFLQEAENYLIAVYMNGYISMEVIAAAARLMRDDNEGFRRLIMRARGLHENTPWPAYDKEFRKTSFSAMVRSAAQMDAEQGNEYRAVPTSF